MVETIQRETVQATATDKACIKERPKLTIPEQIAHMRDVKGINFTVLQFFAAHGMMPTSKY